MNKFATDRPLAPVRRALESGQAVVAAALHQWHIASEARLQQSENAIWAQDRTIQELAGYLGRIAAIVGIDVGPHPDWNPVVESVSDLADRVARLSLESRQARERTEALQRRADQSAAALARVAARLGVVSRDPADLLSAIDRLV